MNQLPADRKARNSVILAIQRAILATFDRSDWKELAYRTGTEDEITGHHRLLRSLDWDDPDYGANVLWGIETIIELDNEGLHEIFRTAKIRNWLKEHDESVYLTFASESSAATRVASPSPQFSTSTVDRALSDAETLLRTSGATSAVDRVHTALHGYMKALCDNENIEYRPDSGITGLFKLLKKEHPELQPDGPRSQDITKIMNSLSSVVDALDPVRNRASVAHPNPVLLDAPEAELAVNAARTVIHYLNARIGAAR